MKDLGPLIYFLGLEVSRTVDGYMINRQKYTTDLINLACLSDNKRVVTPLEINVNYSKTKVLISLILLFIDSL